MQRMYFFMAVVYTLLFNVLHAQNTSPQGELYFQQRITDEAMLDGYRNVLGYLSYPNVSYTEIGEMPPSDLFHHQNYMYAAAGKYPHWEAEFDGRVFCWHHPTKTFTDTIHNAQALQVRAWKDQLIVTSLDAPHFRVYDINNNYAPLYTLNTAQEVPVAPIDILVANDKAYLLFNHLLADSSILMGIQVINLANQEAEVYIPLEEYIPIWPALQVSNLATMVLAQDKIYIDVAYITNAYRFSLLSVDINSLNPVHELYTEGYANEFSLLAVQDRVYLGYFDTHYSIPDDSLFINQEANKIPLTYDPISNSIFVTSAFGAGSLTYYDLDTELYETEFSATIENAYIWQSFHRFNPAVFVPMETVDGITHTPFPSFSLHPNPTNKQVHISFKEMVALQEIQFLDVKGRSCKTLQFSDTANSLQKELNINVADLQAGTYLCKVLLKNGQSGQYKFVKF